MKVFLKRVLVFAIIPMIALFTIFMVFNALRITGINQLKLNANIETVFIGDSHIELGIDDKLLENSINFAKGAESFYFSYYKLKRILSDNPQIDKVYLGYSYHSLSAAYDEFIVGERSVSSNYFFMLPLLEQVNYLKRNDKKLLFYIKTILKAEVGSFFSNSNYLGGYSNRFINAYAVKTSMDKRLKSQFFDKKRPNDFSTINLSYLKKIIVLCKSKGVELILLNTPLHPYYKSKIPKEYLSKYEQIIASNNLKVICFSDLNLADDCFIPDGDHLSVKGAFFTTNQLIKYDKALKNNNQ